VHKVFNEWQAGEYCDKHGMSFIGIRAANVASNDKMLGSVDHVRCVVGPALGEKVVLPYCDRTRCIIHADDVAQVFATIAMAKKPMHRIYNSGGESLSLAQIAGMVRRRFPEADITSSTRPAARAYSAPISSAMRA
jgi:nucleoside-diphosphate-sugar epimerase